MDQLLAGDNRLLDIEKVLWHHLAGVSWVAQVCHQASWVTQCCPFDQGVARRMGAGASPPATSTPCLAHITSGHWPAGQWCGDQSHWWSSNLAALSMWLCCYLINNLPTAWSHWGTSQPECYTFSNYTIVVPFPRTWPCTFLCTHFSSPALHQKLCFAYLEECPGLTFNYHIDWKPNNQGVQTVSHGADMVNHRIVKRVAETKPEADAFARAC